MIRKLFLISLIFCFSTIISWSQFFVSSSDLFKRTDGNSRSGQLKIIQDPALDTLMSRYILANQNLEEKNGYIGVEGFRIQIYNSSNRNAKEESSKVRQEFMSQFPEMVSYLIFAPPAYYKVRVGNFRSKTEAMRLYLTIARKFPNSEVDIIPDIINLKDLNNK
ncbi:MAG: SPOR domain-containing protein [Bacteroidales bacterium]